MSLIIAAAILGFVVGFLIWRQRQDEAEKGFKLGYIVYRASFLPVYILIMYSLLNTGGLLALSLAFLLSAMAVLFILVFEPHKDIRQYRRQ